MDVGIGIVTQETSLADDLSVWENIILPFYGSKKSYRKKCKIWRKVPSRLGLPDAFSMDKLCAALSAAQRQW